VRVRGLGQVTAAGEDREPGILGKAMVCKREIAEDKDRPAGGFDAAGMQAIGAEAGSKGVIRLLLCARHENKDSAVRGAVIVRMESSSVVSLEGIADANCSADSIGGSGVALPGTARARASH
jgi:hypothetical protein